MPAFNPGVLESLVGVTFAAGSRLTFSAPTSANAAAGTLTISDGSTLTNSSATGETVTAVNSSYTAGFSAYDPSQYAYIYYFPSFGTINFGGTQYYIFGATENGLVLSLNPFLIQNPDGTLSEPITILSNTPNPTYPLNFDNDASAYAAPVCFVEGTRLLTTRGPVAVENLVEGDEMVTAGGGVRPAIWIGSRQVRCDRHPRPAEVQPILVRAGAFGEGLPSADLRLSPGHSVHVDGALTPVGLLVNGATIVQEAVELVRYFHVELDAHDILLAEDLPCESYLDDGNRQVFGNAPGHLALYGRLDPQDWDKACAPVLREGPKFEALRADLRSRALALGWTFNRDAQVSLEADGVSLAPVFSSDDRFWFLAPPAQRLVLRSPATVPALAAPEYRDRRLLGVAVSELRIGGATVDLASEALNCGFHALEVFEAEGRRQAWRWTDGAAELPPLQAQTMIEVTVAMVSPRWVAPDQALNQASPLAPRLRLVEAG
ncbi:Hint domain-containing protein [Caulobacter endophyticus]|uniref:Hint domain-containing protein n=1 Tax=Caulobacter endophyticus TaxID=2172652 RepID=UPI00240FAB40|nr:Hint domain-containing protein [Caulobacter endophyticus]MDG2527251.1 Hint domain-containing protein [Caulobacter endophyticus]